MNDSLRELLGFDNHYKLVATLSWLGGMAFQVWFVLHGAPYTFLLAWGSMSMALPYGLKGLTAWLNRRGAEADAIAIRDEAAALIAARRAKVGNDFEPTD